MGRVCGLHKLRVLGPPLTSTQATSGTCWAEISWNIATFKSLTWAPFAIFRIAGGRLHASSIYFSSRGWWSTAHWHSRLAWWLHKHRLVAKRTRSKRNVSCRHWFGMLKTLILFPQCSEITRTRKKKHFKQKIKKEVRWIGWKMMERKQHLSTFWWYVEDGEKHGQQKSKWNLEHTPPGCRHARWFCCRVACSAAGTETCHILVLPVSNHCHVTAATITSDRKICPPPPSGCPEGACWDCSHVSHNMAQLTGSPSSLPYESLWPMTNQKPTLSVAAVLALHGFAELWSGDYLRTVSIKSL